MYTYLATSISARLFNATQQAESRQECADSDMGFCEMTEEQKDAEGAQNQAEVAAPPEIAAEVAAPTAVPAPAEAAPLAPGVPRLEAPDFAARTVVEPVLNPPSGIFLFVVAAISFVLDIGSKLWAEKRPESNPNPGDLIENHLAFTLARNKGGAWGLLQSSDESLRRPFFLIVSVAAISFIVTLYRRLHPNQLALKWGLPLVLGGALGNVFDRIRYGQVIDFIDYRAEWVRKMNEIVAKRVVGHYVTDHWPTFNIADVAICVGVGLMAVDMFTSKRGPAVSET
jgi:signal peptidase II